jgi:polysaccharide chain length determinant protein (PEP-CTERM system associated)
MDNAHVSPLDYVSVIRRRRWWWITPIALSIVTGWLLVRFVPKEYKSSTTLGVTAPLVSPSIVSQVMPSDNFDRMRAIQQQLVSTPILSRVAREEQLSDVGLLRNAIEIKVPDPVANTNEVRRLDTFVVSYTDSDPSRAQRVANRLGRVFVDENSKVRTERAEDTTMFINAQLAASQTRINDLETRLRKAKESYMGQLPEQTGANLQTIAGLRAQIVSDETAIRGERDRMMLIDRQIDAIDKNTVDEPAPGRIGDALASPELRVLSLQRELAAARAIYKDAHPEVQRIQEELAYAKKEAQAAQQQPQADRLARLQRNPSYLSLVSEREVGRARIKDLQRDQADAQGQIARYQARVEAAPMVEQQLTNIQREYDLERQQYNDLSSRQRAAVIAASVERNRSGERFEVIDPASYPTTPLKPLPLRLWLGSLLGGLVVGAGLTLLREYVDSSVHDERELRDALELPILGSIARITA